MSLYAISESHRIVTSCTFSSQVPVFFSSSSNKLLGSIPGVRVSSLSTGDPPTGPVIWLSKLRHHDHREAIRDPVQYLRHHRVHVRDRQRHHRHLRLIPRVQASHPSLARHG